MANVGKESIPLMDLVPKSSDTKIIIDNHKTHDLNKTKCLLQAAEQGHLESCKFLIENKADVNLQDEYGQVKKYTGAAKI